ncbi:MAG: hypothetical protein AAGA03_18225, partial [Planctomycetota bacterium]
MSPCSIRLLARLRDASCASALTESTKRVRAELMLQENGNDRFDLSRRVIGLGSPKSTSQRGHWMIRRQMIRADHQ